MKGFSLALGLLALSACTPKAVQTPAPAGPATLDSSGYGPVKIGMTPAEAEAALGKRLVPDMDFDEPAVCQTLHAEGAQREKADVTYLAEKGRLSRISAYAPASMVKTPQGVGPGSDDADIRKIYGAAAIEQKAAYDDPPAHDFVIWRTVNTRGLRFEIGADGKAFALHAGGPAILYMEGCL